MSKTKTMSKTKLICGILGISESTFYRNKKSDTNIVHLLTWCENDLNALLFETNQQNSLKPTKTHYLETIDYKDKKLDVFECVCENIIAVERRGFGDVQLYCNFCEQTSWINVSHTYKQKEKSCLN